MRVLLIAPPRRYWPFTSEGDNYLLQQALPHLASVLRAEGGIEINRSEAGKLKPEDIVIGVAGRVVNSFGDLRHALAGRAPGDRVPVTVLRKGKRTTVEHRLGGQGEELPSSESTTTVVQPAPKAPKKARAIRAALFGKDLH